MPRWLLVLLMIFVGFCLLSMTAFVCLPWILQSFHPPVGTVIVYEMEDVKATQNPSEIAAKTVDLLNLRLNRGFRLQLAHVQLGEGNRIEVGVYGADLASVKQVEEIVEDTGTLEFRIVANVYKHQAEIDIAQKDSDKSTYYDSQGEWTARWVPFEGGEIFQPKVNLVRTRKINDKEITEVLVVRDPYDVTGDFLASARPGSDERGSPCIFFSFNSQGGRLFGGLTGDNLPNNKPDFKNQLGIILNDVLYSAPNINSVITDNGQITGNFTRPQVERMVSCLNNGSLPTKLRKVEERKAETK